MVIQENILRILDLNICTVLGSVVLGYASLISVLRGSQKFWAFVFPILVSAGYVLVVMIVSFVGFTLPLITQCFENAFPVSGLIIP